MSKLRPKCPSTSHAFTTQAYPILSSACTVGHVTLRSPLTSSALQPNNEEHLEEQGGGGGGGGKEGALGPVLLRAVQDF